MTDDEKREMEASIERMRAADRLGQVHYMFHPDYLAKDFRRWRNPIYDAPIEERLADLKRGIELAELLLKTPGAMREDNSIPPSDEFAIGNWIVRPRF